ncbi:GNAT family N-acetyltransferase [Acidovorax sp. SUPP2522]|uniref:GNAT family N-acetyltransferase n=1 Tax=unclassified Acidovorax TaxID=2684926 RepID=UPI002349BBD5|nr:MULTISPECIES: GNAT family protein [unclassified Acidovorax]WCM95582.1 GNAT family N-acetyltransferase [Acidovorax sp. GBBC 1281]GKT17774.1 GNAT family N-acetyltransferase [Acidovorax sp. SUPP2522]
MTFFPTLETPRLRLRKMVAADAPAMLAMHADAESRQWAGYNAIHDLEGAMDFVNWTDQLTQRPVPGFCWAIERKDAPGMIGQCNFTQCDAATLSAALGYELAAPYQGLGFMNEAIGRVLNWCFLHLQLMRISATVHPDNLPSIRMLQRWMFQREGLLRSAGFWSGRHHDLLSFSLLAMEFAPAYALQAQGHAAALSATAARAEELAEA